MRLPADITDGIWGNAGPYLMNSSYFKSLSSSLYLIKS